MRDDFLKHQLSFSRIKNAAAQHDDSLKELFQESELNYPPAQLCIQVFKQEKTVLIWACDNGQYQLIRTYPFTATSGTLGPKQKEGDLQIPEGFYHITNFNPESKFHLSIRINYPNEADKIRNQKQQNIGGDIYIHGGERTCGCIPIGDENISELYWLCTQTYAINPIISIHIFPCKMEEVKLIEIYTKYQEHIGFWNSLKPMYTFFKEHKKLADITSCDNFGNYKLAIPAS